MEITKAGGHKEPYDEEKLRESLERSGVRSDIVEKVVKKTERHARRLPHTENLFNRVRHQLSLEDPIAAMRYGLKRSMLKLGPGGHPFEYYFARVLDAHGYETVVGSIVDGHCVPHEIDVIATRGDERIMIESKFHTKPGIRSRLKDSLYIQARYVDVKDEKVDGVCSTVNPTTKEDLLKSTTHVVHDRGYSAEGKSAKRGFTSGALVTNTKVTLDGRMYAACSGLRIISWRYPEEGSLEQLIEEKRVYPVAIFSELSKKQMYALFEHRIFTIQDLIDLAPNRLSQIVRLRGRQVHALQDAAKKLLQT